MPKPSASRGQSGDHEKSKEGVGRGGGVIDPLIKKCPNGNKRTTSDAVHFVNGI